MSPETRAFVAAVRTMEDPTPGDESRVFDALRGALAAGGELAGAGAPSAAKLAGASSVSGLKLAAVLGVLVAGAGAGGAFAARQSSGVDARPQSRAADVRAAPPPAPRPSVASTAATPRPTAAAPASASNRERPLPSAARVPSVRGEIALLADVRAALGRGDGAAALARLDEHVTNDRQFLAERRAARILALCALGRADEARRAAAAFAQEHAGSVQRSAVERSCAGGAIDGER
jgi:hypothetical protein